VKIEEMRVEPVAHTMQTRPQNHTTTLLQKVQRKSQHQP
jgi:hypothetical protein